MTLEELWELFPLSLVDPKPRWEQQYEAMERKLSSMIPSASLVSIEHVGSTALETIKAKDIVDVLVVLEPDANMRAVAEELACQGFIQMSASDDRISLNYGYTPEGYAENVYHVHLRFAGDDDELYFLDYLKAHPEVAREYERLKVRLLSQFPHDRDGYTEAKSDFVRKWTEKAKQDAIWPQCRSTMLPSDRRRTLNPSD